jgi:hypothetical protein
MNPGRSVMPVKSMVCTPAGMVTPSAGPTDRIVSPIRRTAASGIGSTPVPSITVAWRSASVGAWAAGCEAGLSPLQAVRIIKMRMKAERRDMETPEGVMK